MIKIILTEPNKILRTKSSPVDPQKIKTPEFQALISDMIETMTDADGVGLAANQIGLIERVIIATIKEPTPFINPKIIGHSILKTDSEEGCLSVPGRWGVVKRWRSVKIKALDKAGKETRMNLKGLPAIVLQHEIDHLDGILFIDKLVK
ncbi:MAG: peptide deformylase [Patescibacteria group bacterium]